MPMVDWQSTHARLEAALPLATGPDLQVGREIHVDLQCRGTYYDLRYTPAVDAQKAAFASQRFDWSAKFQEQLEQVDSVARWAEGKQLEANSALERYLAEQSSTPEQRTSTGLGALVGRFTRERAATSGLEPEYQTVDGMRFKLDATTPTSEWLAEARTRADLEGAGGASAVASPEELDRWQLEQVRARLQRAAKLPALSAEDLALIRSYQPKLDRALDGQPTWGGRRQHAGVPTMRELEQEVLVLVAKAESWLEAL